MFFLVIKRKKTSSIIKMTIILIGMPGVGKSSMGKYLAKKLKNRHIDGDKLIIQSTGKKLQEIIDTEGLDSFMEIERNVLLSINDDNAVITPGGSAIYYDDVMEHFKSIGKVIYLYAGIPVITERLGDFSQRGVVLKSGSAIKDMFNERIPLLEKYSDLKINCNGSSFTSYQRNALLEINALLENEK
jgi:shikimate kinase